MSEYPSRKELFVITSADENDNSLYKNRTREFHFNFLGLLRTRKQFVKFINIRYYWQNN